jgi:hypothetical protein
MRYPFFTCCVERFRFSKLLVQFQQALESFLMGLTHDNQITFSFFSNINGLILPVAQLGNFIGSISLIGYRSYKSHGFSSLFIDNKIS